MRCNLQIEGTGPEARGRDPRRRQGLRRSDARAQPGGSAGGRSPSGYAKHVVLRVDRADGFVGRNFLMRGAQEHGFYNEEIDGILLDRVKFFWNADYGHLELHLRPQPGPELRRRSASGDAVVYPGAAPETGSQATDFYPDAPRVQHRRSGTATCTARRSATRARWATPSGSRTTTSTATSPASPSDTLSAAGHPGFPADSSKIDHNCIYANNLDLYVDDPPCRAAGAQCRSAPGSSTRA